MLFKSIVYESILTGIDLEFETNTKQDDLKSSFYLAKAKMLQNIKIKYTSATLELKINPSGELEWSDGNSVIQMVESVPIFFQNDQKIKGKYYFDSNNLVGFQYANPNNHKIELNKPLVVDPNYSTYLGSTDEDDGFSLWNDQNNDTLVGGYTLGSDFPVTFGAADETYNGDQDGFLLKTSDGESLIWCSFIGSDQNDHVCGIRTDSNANPVITGSSENVNSGANFPTTGGAYKTFCSFAGYAPFITKFKSDGSDLIWSTVVCPTTTGKGIGLDIDESDIVYATGSQMGELEGCANSGSTDYDVYILKLKADGSGVLGSTCFAGDYDESPKWYGNRPIVVKDNYIYTTGETQSTNFAVSSGTYQPTNKGVVNCYITKLSKSTLDLVWNTYFGNNEETMCISLDVNSQGEIWVSAFSDDPYLPTTNDAYQKEFSGKANYYDAVYLRLSADGSNLLFASYLGNYDEDDRGYSIRVDSDDRLLLSGCANPFHNFNYDYDYGRGSYVAIFEPSGSDLLKKITIGGLNAYSVDIFENIYHIALTGSSTPIYEFDTTLNVVQPNFVGGDRDAILLNLNMNCKVGEYGTNEGCQLCPGGTYNNQTRKEELKSCLDCEKGSYSETGAFECTQCSPGTYAHLDSLTACFFCPKGSWSDIVGADTNSFCTECITGTYSNVLGATSIDECLNCTYGTYSTIDGSDSNSNCVSCPKGTWSDILGSNSLANCNECDAGTYSEVLGATSIDECLKCEIGTYSTIEGSDSELNCVSCPKGTWSDILGSNSLANCHECDAGTFSEVVGATSISDCLNCSIGTYSTIGGSNSESNCVSCPKGTYNPNKGSNSINECIKCPSGTYNPNFNSGSIDDCTNCPKGTYSTLEGISSKSNCIPCPEGTYSDVEGINTAEKCKLCPVGTYSNKTGSTSEEICEKCIPGTYNNKPGARGIDFCIDCGIGTFNPYYGGDSIEMCTICPEGQISPGKGGTSCRVCNIGEQPSEHKDSCVKCSAGYFSDEPGLGDCKKCPSGTFNDEDGLTSCLKCSQQGACLGGNVCSEGRNKDTFCSQCATGYYLINSECKKCPNDFQFYVVIACIVLIILFIMFFRRRIARFAKSTKNPMKGIIFTFLQFFAALLTLTFDWPDLLSGKIRVITSVLNLQVGVFAAPECYRNLTFFERWIIMFLIPIILSFFVMLLYLNYYLKLRSQPERLDKRKHQLCRWYTMFLKWIYLPYLLVSFEPFQFSYQNINDNYTLDSDPSITIESKKYHNWLPLFIFSLLIYVFGIPISFAIILVKAKKANFNEYYYKRFSWMFRWYKPKRYWFELFEICFKFVIMATTVFFNFHSKSQAWTVMSLFLAIVLLHLLLRPYKNEDETLFLSPEDKASIGFFIILLAIVSLSLEYLHSVLFIILYPMGSILVYLGCKNNWKWFKQSRKEMIKEFDENEVERKERSEERKRQKSKRKIELKITKVKLKKEKKKAKALKKLEKMKRKNQNSNPNTNEDSRSDSGSGSGSCSSSSSSSSSGSGSGSSLGSGLGSKNPNNEKIIDDLNTDLGIPLTELKTNKLNNTNLEEN
ncbi:hypothetical protein M0812_21918 [Anaeramoeba flamelloides]|uniref:Tyrosine-protein kinase ephrin type A/B receptor-like domain-containing protein n=1 Tax=Anaeramoeba flamelloides TaxID=1746091 RepID=A0AAV7YW99_9EUKA|nr:hypothetical protein M0812_21918 [Anaeramoeba flamelloides]